MSHGMLFQRVDMDSQLDDHMVRPSSQGFNVFEFESPIGTLCFAFEKALQHDR